MVLSQISFSWSFLRSKGILCDFDHFQWGFGIPTPFEVEGLGLGEASNGPFLLS
jgi:hypothetical protein